MKILLIIAILMAPFNAFAAVVKPTQVAMEYQTIMSYDGSNQIEYVGTSLEPCTTSEACWQIKKLTYSGSNLTNIQWANGNHSFDFIWTSRASYTYS